jgi:hypothetical protein
MVGEESVGLCACVLLDNHLGIARASVAAHLRCRREMMPTAAVVRAHRAGRIVDRRPAD